MELNQLTIKQAQEGLRNKKFSSVELTRACLDQIKKTDKKINAFITVCEKEALESSKKADKLFNNLTIEQLSNDLPLLGIPIALKDLFSTKDIKTTAASKVLKNYVPVYDATVVKKLKDAGAIIIGKTNCDAWAHGSSGENSDFSPTKNPWDTEYVPGGSSSGSAAALAANMCLAATGTDTGGSIRLPASFCNVVGLKPTYGRVSRYGIIAMASSLDSIGHFTKTVEDSQLMLSIIAGKDLMDATTLEKKCATKPFNEIKIGVDSDFFSKHIEIESLDLLKKACNVLLGLKNNSPDYFIPDISLPHQDYGIACYYIIQPAEVSSNLARYDGIRYGSGRAYFREEAKRRIMLGTYTLSAGYYDAYYKKAMQVRTLIKQDFDKAFEKVDAIIAPVSPTPPWKLGEKINDPLSMYLSDKFTVTANIAGIPALSIPIGITSKGLPVGMQIISPHFSENILFEIGKAYEEATKHESWRKVKPKL